jgi:hypothetical protein
MAAYILFAFAGLAVTAGSVVAGRQNWLRKKARDDERRRRMLQNFRLALGD